ncbi:Polyadenylation and cleavage factor-like protein 4 [Bienertia sinuspersici]
MPNDVVSKLAAPSPILDRFRFLLKERESEFRVPEEENDVVSAPPPTMEEIVRYYEDVLSELTFNSKPIITDLTIIAGEQREYAEGIADAICARVLEVQVDQKLPSLYLLDSIVKNIGREYVRHFACRLPEVQSHQGIAYKQAPSNMHPSMRHLFGTWSTVFPLSVLRKIEDELQFSPKVNQPSSNLTSMRASESPRPSHGIHVNPKYLEARRQFDNPSISNNIQPGRGTPNLKSLGQKHSIGCEEYDYYQVEGTNSHIDAQRYNSTGYGGRTSFPLPTEMVLSSAGGLARPLSPSVDDFAVSSSPGRVFERASPSHSGYNYGRRRGREEETVDWKKRLRSDDSYRGFGNVSNYGLSNGFEHDRPRALIDAYGQDDGQRPMGDKPLGIDRLVVNGAASKVAENSWQNTEEEEFDWEDMSPTLAEGKGNDVTASALLSKSFRPIPGVDSVGSRPFDPSLRRNWATSSQISRLEDSQRTVEDGGHLSFNKPFSRNEMNHPHGAWKLPGSLSVPVSVTGRENTSLLTLPRNGMPSSSSDGNFSSADHFAAVSMQLGRVSNVMSRVVSSGFSSFEARAPPPAVAPVPTVSWSSTNSHNLGPLPPAYMQQKHPRASFDFRNQSYTVLNKGHQQFSTDDPRSSIPGKPAQRPQLSFTPLHHLTQQPVSLQQQLHSAQEPRQNAVSTVASLAPQTMPPSVSLGFTPLGHGVVASNIVRNPVPGSHPYVPIQNVSNGSSMQFQAHMTSLPIAPRPHSQFFSFPQSSGPTANQPPGPAISGLLNSGLLNSLVAQGLFPLKQTSVQEPLGVEFNPDLLKVRHESAIRALYEELPRQCTTCGLRFKTQEEHSKHMDWHVTKNRISRNRKHNPSRKWFVSVSMWLSGAEALGTDAAPGFLPTENAVEKMDDEEMAVPADEDQNACALCGELFEDFYSDEAEEWMYRGAVYLNAPSGSTIALDRSQLGPIVHAKCRSDSGAAPA